MAAPVTHGAQPLTKTHVEARSVPTATWWAKTSTLLESVA